jgi:hypothetical protein
MRHYLVQSESHTRQLMGFAALKLSYGERVLDRVQLTFALWNVSGKLTVHVAD